MQKFLLANFLLIFSFAIGMAEEKSGELEGLLVSKGKNGEFVEIIPDGSETAVKYIPEWVGGNPNDGGGFKKETVETIKKLITPNRVLLKWKNEEHLRVVEIKILEPQKKEGVAKGLVTNVKEGWFELKITEKEKVRIERFMPRWIGKMPKDGGGLDKEMVEEISKLKVGDSISVTWTYDERKRVTKISKDKKD